ncbi:tyrosine-type recombinase/integrase [Burkholderia diffusa]|uniref:tyrosine-type recombinase/integrase n=1 Tax=Burkholderia diffusa TaxID=488732 RepID=UPI001E5FBFF5|nr:tyrosine-type recombinase/integrase [Burkholderia diffusa]
MSGEGLHAGSFVPLLRTLFREAGLPTLNSYSSHSLRRGFATWANSNGWDLKMLMEYVGWKDVRSAMRYIDAADPFAQHRIESALTVMPPPAPTQPAIAEPAKTQSLADEITTSSTPQTHLSLHLVIERNSKFVRRMSKAHRWIEDFCHSLYEMRCVNRQTHAIRDRPAVCIRSRTGSGDRGNCSAKSILPQRCVTAWPRRCCTILSQTGIGADRARRLHRTDASPLAVPIRRPLCPARFMIPCRVARARLPAARRCIGRQESSMCP